MSDTTLTGPVIDQLNNLPGFPPAEEFCLGDYLVQNGTTVPTVEDRNNIPIADRVSGMLVKSAASGIVWVLGDDLTTWTPIDNQNPALYEVDPTLGFAIHSIKVETPGNGGSDTEGEGTEEHPFATIGAGLAATISKGSDFTVIFIDVGPGTFVEDDDFSFLASRTSSSVSIRGSINVLATIPLASQTPIGLIAGKQAQFRTDIGAYGFAVTEGDTYAKIEFAGFEDFPNYYPAVGTSASPNIDLVNSNAPFGDLIIFEQLTTVTNSAGSLFFSSQQLNGIQVEAIKVRPASGFLSTNNCGFAACDLSAFGGSNVISANFFTGMSGCYVDIAAIQTGVFTSSINTCLIESGTITILDTLQTSSMSRLVFRENGLAISLGEIAGGPIGRGNGKIFAGAIDLEDGSGILVDGAGSHFILQGSIGAGSADPVTRALHVKNGGFYQRSFGTWVGTTAGVCVIVDTQGLVLDTVASFDGSLANSSTPGDEITVGGNAVATFAGAPYTDFALGNTSRGAIAR
jgi:hypothetical protein